MAVAARHLLAVALATVVDDQRRRRELELVMGAYLSRLLNDPVPISRHWFDMIFPAFTPRQFRSRLRMQRDTFDRLAAILDTHMGYTGRGRPGSVTATHALTAFMYYTSHVVNLEFVGDHVGLPKVSSSGSHMRLYVCSVCMHM